MTRDEAFAHFLAAWPAYRDTTRLDDLQAHEYGRLDATGHVYLDDTGGGAALESGPEMTLPRFMQFIQHHGGRSAGALRVSLGIASNFADAHRLLELVGGLRDQERLAIGDVTFDIQSCRVIRDGA